MHHASVLRVEPVLRYDIGSFAPEMLQSHVFPGANSNKHPVYPEPRRAIPQHSNHVRVGPLLRRGFSPSAPEMLHPYVFPGANPNRHPAIPQDPNNLQVTIDIRYQYAIMLSLSWHDSSVPCEPCAPATRSF